MRLKIANSKMEIGCGVRRDFGEGIKGVLDAVYCER
jgi:hypothetical protein